MKIPWMILWIMALPFFLHSTDVDFPFSSKIVFVSNFEGNNELYMISSNRLERLTDNPANDQWPVLSNAGDRLVFTSDREGNFNIYIMDLKTREVKKMSSDSRDEVDPSWSNNDLFLFFTLYDGGNPRIMKMNAKTGHSSLLFQDKKLPGMITLFQSPLGDEFVFTAKAFLGWTMAKYRPSTAAYQELGSRGSCRPKYSPDGKSVAYVSQEDDGLGDVWMIDHDGGNARNMTPMRKKSYDYYPAFSPDGKWIVFSSSPEEKGKKGYDLYLLDVQSREIKPLFLSNGNDSYPFWGK